MTATARIPSRTRGHRKARESGFGVPTTSDRSDSGSSSGAQAGYTSTSDDDEDVDDSVSIMSSGDDEVDYSFRYREPAAFGVKTLSTPRSTAIPVVQLPTLTTPTTPVSQKTRLKISLSRRATLGQKGGLAVREDEWERWERISREQVMVSLETVSSYARARAERVASLVV